MIRNLITAFFTRGFVALCNLAILLITSRHLGSSILGEVSLLILNITVIQTLLDIYTGPALVHFIPRSNIRRIYNTGFIWIVFGTILLNAVLYFMGTGTHEIWYHVFLLSFLATLHAFHLVMILAREKIRIYNFLVLLQPAVLLTVLSLNIFVLKIHSLNSNIVAMYAAWGISVLISSFILARVLSNAETTMGAASFLKILRNGAVNQLGNLAHILSNRYNYYILGAAALVGVYSAGTSLIESAWIISASISPIVLTFVANRSDSMAGKTVTFLLAKVCFVVSFLVVGVLLLVPQDLFVFVLGEEFREVKEIMLYLSPGVLCISFSSIISHYFSGLGQQRVMLWANCSGLMVTLCTSYFFITRFGIAGACYTASLAYFMQSLVLTIMFMKQNSLGMRSLFSLWKELGELRVNS